MPEMYQLLTQFAATGSEADGSHAAEPEGLAALGIDPFAILAAAGTFLLFYLVVKKFALGKIVATLEERRRVIDSGIRLGHEMEAEQARLEEKVEAALKKARDEADKIIASGHEEAGGIIKEAEQAAGRKADAILAEAQAKITEDMEQARKGLEQEVLALVADATEAVIKERLDARKDASLLEEAVKQAKGA